MNRTTTYIIVAVVIIVIVVAGVLAYVVTRPGGTSGGGTHIDVYASDSPYGFGMTAGSITSPGPNIPLVSGQTYTIELHNVGTVPHNFAITKDQVDGSTNLAFSGAQIASSSNAVPPGSTASCTFTASSAGSYYYICQVDHHVTLGMYGTVTVT
jgi:plastocyanin